MPRLQGKKERRNSVFRKSPSMEGWVPVSAPVTNSPLTLDFCKATYKWEAELDSRPGLQSQCICPTSVPESVIALFHRCLSQTPLASAPALFSLPLSGSLTPVLPCLLFWGAHTPGPIGMWESWPAGPDMAHIPSGHILLVRSRLGNAVLWGQLLPHTVEGERSKLSLPH